MVSNMQKCPYCAEEILKDAKKCKFCKEDINVSQVKKIKTPKKELLKKCPSCKEEIKQDANKCKHCGEIQDTLESKKQIQQQKRASAQEESRKGWLNWLLWVIFIGALWFLMSSDWYWDLIDRFL